MNPVQWFLLTDLSSLEILIATIIKSNIHNSRLKSIKPSVETFVQSLKWEATKEYKIAQAKDKLNNFEQKWGALQQILTKNT